MHGIKLKSRTFAIDLYIEKCRSKVKVTLKLGQRSFTYISYAIVMSVKLSTRYKFCDYVPKIMIANGYCSISSPKG